MYPDNYCTSDLDSLRGGCMSHGKILSCLLDFGSYFGVCSLLNIFIKICNFDFSFIDLSILDFRNILSCQDGLIIILQQNIKMEGFILATFHSLGLLCSEPEAFLSLLHVS